MTKAQNTHVFRYADVLLMLAEALHRGTGEDALAMMYIDEVRERAAGPGNNIGNYRTSAEVMAEEGWSLLDLIWYERRAELACEGDRWFDLVRSGRANADLFEETATKRPTSYSTGCPSHWRRPKRFRLDNLPDPLNEDQNSTSTQIPYP